MRDRGTKAIYKGENIVTGAAKRYLLSPDNVLDLWVNESRTRCFVVVREWQKQRKPEPQTEAIYCGEIFNRTISQGELEYKIMRALDRHDNPWKYAKRKTFLVDDGSYLHEIPRDNVTSYKWRPLIGGRNRVDAVTEIMQAENQAVKMFDEHPELKEMVVDINDLRIMVRGHGRYIESK